ncbi:MAG TPA: hypothetical protein VEK84_16055 [Terriglobales bacterium]|nr:hypothetical protein [Terriglobales bacterium]
MGRGHPGSRCEPVLLVDLSFTLHAIAKSLRMWQALLMAKSKLTAREKARQERERARSLEDHKKKAAELQQKAKHGATGQADTGIAKPVAEC